MSLGEVTDISGVSISCFRPYGLLIKRNQKPCVIWVDVKDLVGDTDKRNTSLLRLGYFSFIRNNLFII